MYRIVYFTNATSLWSCDYDGTNIKQLVNTFTDAGALAVGTNGKGYVFVLFGTQKTCRIGRIEMTMMTLLIEMTVMTLSVRPCVGTVYVGDKTQQVLVAINTQTLHTVNILTPGDWQVVGVAVDMRYVYFTTWDQRLAGDLDLKF